MTKEEAIKELSVEYVGDSEKIKKAKRMAIKALEQDRYFWEKCPYYEPDMLFDGKDEYDMGQCKYKQEHCEDAISRQATLEPYKTLKDADTLCVGLVRANILQQKTVNPYKSGKWIPVSERLPQNATNGEALCMLFPNMHYTLSDKSPRVVTTIGVASSFDMDWWNSPYTAGK